MSKCCGVLAKTETWTSNSTTIIRKILPVVVLPSNHHGKLSCMKNENHAQWASACAILHANHDVPEPISCSQFPWLPSFWVSMQKREREKGGRSWDMVVEVRWRKGEKRRMMRWRCEAVGWDRLDKQTHATWATISPALWVILSETTGEQVSVLEFRLSWLPTRTWHFCCEYNKQGRRGAEKQRCRACALPSLGFFCFKWDPQSESTGNTSTIVFPWWLQGALCPLQREEKLKPRLFFCCLVWISVWTLDTAAHIFRATDKPPSFPQIAQHTSIFC